MTNNYEVILEKIAGLKEDMNDVKSDVKDIKKSCACRLNNCNIELNKKITFKSFISTLSIFIVVVGIVIAL